MGYLNYEMAGLIVDTPEWYEKLEEKLISEETERGQVVSC